MITEEEILSRLDNYKLGWYCQFVWLGDVYSNLIDCRLNVFKSGDDKWAVVSERLGYNPRAGGILLDICYFGNCLINLENYNGQDINYYTVQPISWDDFIQTCDGDYLKPGTKSWNIRGQQIELTHNKQEYCNAGIEIMDSHSDRIRLEEVGRFLITKHRDLLRATDEELYKSIPKDLKKLLVIDEWYHRDFNEIERPKLSNQELRYTYEFNKKLVDGEYPLDYESFAAAFRQQEQSDIDYNKNKWLNSRPGSYETWQLIAKVIVKGDPSVYRPTLPPNTHWKNWPDSGSL